jgi:hypothetical protein
LAARAAVTKRSSARSNTSEPAGWQAQSLTYNDTRIPPEHTRWAGVEELHPVHFQHRADRGGACCAVSVQVPEVPRHRIKLALDLAHLARARVLFLCDTHEQAVRSCRLAARLLPEHRFVALERAAAGAFGQLT